MTVYWTICSFIAHGFELVSAQAQDRIHRLGQYKPIHVTRFVIGGTIEERILKLQVQTPLPRLHNSGPVIECTLSSE